MMGICVNNTWRALREFWKDAIVGVACLGMILTVVLTQTHLYINYTPSLPYKAFICSKALTPQYGNFVSIDNHPTHFFKGIHYIKRLIGFPGDHIHIHNDHVYVEKARTYPLIDTYHIGPLSQITQEGKKLHPLERKIIPKNYVFVSADHPRSFDSRYQEFGLVKAECIVGKCFGLFKSDANTQEGNP
jgi:conjugal transfer pilin signal peptidase TrbI